MKKLINGIYWLTLIVIIGFLIANVFFHVPFKSNSVVGLIDIFSYTINMICLSTKLDTKANKLIDMGLLINKILFVATANIIVLLVSMVFGSNLSLKVLLYLTVSHLIVLAVCLFFKIKAKRSKQS